jgi:hypothetical protein
MNRLKKIFHRLFGEKISKTPSLSIFEYDTALACPAGLPADLTAPVASSLEPSSHASESERPGPSAQGSASVPPEDRSYTPIFPEHGLAHRLLDGLCGLEIGAASHNPFGLNTRNVAPPDDFEFYARATRQQFGIGPAPVAIWAYGWDIPLPSFSEDFILSSHVVEHLPNVISTFVEWNRVVRDGGYIFMIVPLKGALPADGPRELTSVEHFIADYQQDLNLETHSTEDVPGGRMGHYHTFTPDSLLEIVEYMQAEGLCQWELVAREDVDTKVGNGFTLVFRVRQCGAFPPKP